MRGRNKTKHVQVCRGRLCCCSAVLCRGPTGKEAIPGCAGPPPGRLLVDRVEPARREEPRGQTRRKSAAAGETLPGGLYGGGNGPLQVWSPLSTFFCSFSFGCTPNSGFKSFLTCPASLLLFSLPRQRLLGELEEFVEFWGQIVPGEICNSF